jgi:hypothetical protein
MDDLERPAYVDGINLIPRAEIVIFKTPERVDPGTIHE